MVVPHPTLLLALLGPAVIPVGPTSGIEGKWQNPKHTTVVNVSVCGEGPQYCAVVIQASAKTQENARRGGTAQFIGTEILRVQQVSHDDFKGTAFDPESNMHVDASVHLVAPGVMDIKGCAMLGLVCQEQRWTKLSEIRRTPSRGPHHKVVNNG